MFRTTNNMKVLKSVMIPSAVNSIKEPVCKSVVALNSSRQRKLQGKFLVEDGADKYLSALASSNLQLSDVIVAEGREQHYQATLLQYGITTKMHVASQGILSKLLRTSKRTDFIGIADLPCYQPEEYYDIPNIVALDNVVNDTNFGSILRSCLAFNVGCVISIGREIEEIFNRTCIRASSTALFKLPILSMTYPDFSRFISKSRHQVIATTPHSASEISDASILDRSVMIFGNETHGISKQLLQSADCKVKIPIADDIESFNVAVSAGILLYHRHSQRVNLDTTLTFRRGLV